MTDRLALLPLTGAGETHCAQCNLRTYFPDLDNATVSACPLDGSDRAWADERFPECLSAERQAARLRAVEVAARELLRAELAMRGGTVAGSPMAALRAALKEV